MLADEALLGFDIDQNTNFSKCRLNRIERAAQMLGMLAGGWVLTFMRPTDCWLYQFFQVDLFYRWFNNDFRSGKGCAMMVAQSWAMKYLTIVCRVGAQILIEGN